jgi:hypothetical protein
MTIGLVGQSKIMKKTNNFNPGDTLIFTTENFNKSWWDKLPEYERIQYYGVLGYGRPKDRPHLYTYLCEHKPQGGHIVLVSMEDQHIETMRHPEDFRLATEDEV